MHSATRGLSGSLAKRCCVSMCKFQALRKHLRVPSHASSATKMAKHVLGDSSVAAATMIHTVTHMITAYDCACPHGHYGQPQIHIIQLTFECPFLKTGFAQMSVASGSTGASILATSPNLLLQCFLYTARSELSGALRIKDTMCLHPEQNMLSMMLTIAASGDD